MQKSNNGFAFLGLKPAGDAAFFKKRREYYVRTGKTMASFESLNNANKRLQNTSYQ
jgi:hypothetical protein